MSGYFASRHFAMAPVFLLVLAISACVPQREPLYYWGNYESLIYNTYVKPGDADPQKQIDLLTEDIQKSENNGKPVAPGIYAHLGFMYATQGNIKQAENAFLEEKKLYPESAVLIDGMLKRARAHNKQNK